MTVGWENGGCCMIMWIPDEVKPRRSSLERRVALSERDVVEQTREPVTVDVLRTDLQSLGVQPGMVLLVHSSLSALGWVCGGPVAVILALEEALTPGGTLVMPAMTGDLTDPKDWEHPPIPESWKEIVRATTPAYDPALTPSRGMGAIAEAFRKQSGVVRSLHPHCSFAAWGRHAKRVTAEHSLDFGLGEDSPLARIYELDGWILLLGVGHANNTSLHLAEYRADFPGKEEAINGAPVWVDGVRCWVTVRDYDLDDEDFPTIGDAFERETEAAQISPVGQGTARLMPQRALVDFAVEWMEDNRQ